MTEKEPDPENEEVFTFAADLWAFAEEHWGSFLAWAGERGYDEERAELYGQAIARRAGRG
jgi:hypothetical protein